MRILLIYPDIKVHVNYPVGLGLISSILKEEGHEVTIIHLNEEMGFPVDLDRIEGILKECSPGLIAFSCTSTQFKYARELSRFFKDHTDAPILCGGIHSTISPEEVLSSGDIDLACVGEGEGAMVELAARLERGEDYRDVKNLAYMDGDELVVNPPRPLVTDLNGLPFPDRQGFDFARIVSLKKGWANIMAGRGCFYKCTYCVNNYFHKVYADQSSIKTHLRLRDVDVVLAEIDGLLTDYDNISLINFDDDIFTMYKEWLIDFCEGYKKHVNLPFACNVQVKHFDADTARALYDAGCREVKIGLESGNEEIRKNVLKRRTPEKTIADAFRTAEEAGIRAWAFNMVGLPTESMDQVMDTVRLNARIRPYILRCSIFYPYKGTELYNYCKEEGLLDDSKQEAYSSYMEGSVLKLKKLSEADILKAKSMFKWLVDSESDTESAELYKLLVKYFGELPDEYWLTNEAQRMVQQMDEVVDTLLKTLKKEHYTSRKHLDLNFTKKLGFELP